MIRTGASPRAAIWTFVIVFVLLIANGRAIGSGDTNAVERTAAALVKDHSFFVEAPADDPFTRAAGAGRISIYPPLTAVVAAPFFALFGVFFDLDPAGVQIAGKLTAALLSSLAIGLLALIFSRRALPRRAFEAAVLIGLGTSIYSTSQALWQHPAVVLFLVIGLGALEDVSALGRLPERGSAALAAFAISLAAAARPAAIPMCAVLLVFLLRRGREHAPVILTAAGLPAIMVCAYNAFWFGACLLYTSDAADE